MIVCLGFYLIVMYSTLSCNLCMKMCLINTIICIIIIIIININNLISQIRQVAFNTIFNRTYFHLHLRI